METRPPSLWARVFATVGLGAQLPKPSGPHLVRSFHHRIPGEHGVLSQVYFPVELVEQESGEGAATLKTQMVKRAYRNGVLTGFSYFSSTPKLLFELFLGASPHPLSGVPASAKIVKHQGGAHSMPLIVFSHGLGGNCEVYTKACSDLASNGFVVVALEHEDGSGSFAKTVDGDVVKYQRPPQGMPYIRENVINFRAPFLARREQEIRRAVNFYTTERDFAALESDKDLAYREDLIHCLQSISAEKVFLAGHSFGAASTVHTVRAWPGRFKGAILMDLWSFPVPDLDAGITDIPVCSLLSETFAHNGEAILTWRLLQKTNKLLCSLYLPGSVHSSFSDTPWWAPKWMAMRFNLRGALEPADAQASFNRVYVDFFRYVLGEDESVSNETSFEDRMIAQDPRLKRFDKPNM